MVKAIQRTTKAQTLHKEKRRSLLKKLRKSYMEFAKQHAGDSANMEKVLWCDETAQRTTLGRNPSLLIPIVMPDDGSITVCFSSSLN